MNTPQTPIRSGLDADIQKVHGLLESPERVRELKAALDNENIGFLDFKKCVPEELIRLAIAGSAGSQVLESLPPQPRAALINIVEEIEKNIGNVRSHPLAFAVMAEQSNQAIHVGDPALQGNKLNSGNVDVGMVFEQVARIVSGSVYVNAKSGLSPMYRIQMFGATGRMLLDTNMMWQNVIFVLGAVSRHFAIEIESSRKLREGGFVELELDKIGTATGELLEANELLMKQLVLLGVLQEESESNAPAQDTQSQDRA